MNRKETQMRLSMDAPARLLALTATLMLTAGAGVAAANAGAGLAGPEAGGGSPVVGHLYVNDNTADANTIAGYDRHANGTLTPIPGSPFAAGGAGTGAVIGSQGALQSADGGKLLLAVDAGSNQISVLAVNPDGTLTAAGAPVSSGGTLPVSLAVHGRRVYVANAGPDDANYTGFTLSSTGALTPAPDTTVALPAAADPGDVVINATGTHLIGARVGTSQIDSFAIDHQGRLRAASGSPFAAQGFGPFGSEFSPTRPGRLYVSNAHGGPNAGTISAFGVGRQGGLNSIGAGPFNDLQTAPCWVEISADGRFLFTVNTAVPSVSRFAIGDDGALQLLGSTSFPGKGRAGFGPQDARLTPQGTTLWVVDSKAAELSGFGVDGGDLTPLSAAQTALPAGSAPFGIVTD
jgi:6-phosphogluconolactonase (cycloisomerase 2 family)